MRIQVSVNTIFGLIVNTFDTFEAASEWIKICLDNSCEVTIKRID